jgi:hypothetical protein
MICKCGATFRRLHPDENHCRCGTIYDGQGKEIGRQDRRLQPLRRVQQPIRREEVGSALAKLIPNWAVSFKEGCGCQDYEKQMNSYGIQGCKTTHYDEIIEHLVGQSDKLIPLFRAVPKAARKAIAKQLLNKAIKNVEKQNGSDSHERSI